MAEPTISQLIGTGTTWLDSANSNTGAGLFIPASLFSTTSPSSDKGDALVIDLLIDLLANATQLQFDTDIDRSIYVERGFSNFIPRGINNTQYRVNQIVFNLAKIDTDNSINPDDY